MLMSNKSVNLLKTTTNTIAHELIYTAIKCDVNANIYREYSGYLSLCSNLIAFPLIILTSGNKVLIASLVPSFDLSSTKKTVNLIFVIYF